MTFSGIAREIFFLELSQKLSKNNKQIVFWANDLSLTEVRINKWSRQHTSRNWPLIYSEGEWLRAPKLLETSFCASSKDSLQKLFCFQCFLNTVSGSLSTSTSIIYSHIRGIRMNPRQYRRKPMAYHHVSAREFIPRTSG